MDLRIRSEAAITQTFDKRFDRFIRKSTKERLAAVVAIQDGFYAVCLQEREWRCLLQDQLLRKSDKTAYWQSAVGAMLLNVNQASRLKLFPAFVFLPDSMTPQVEAVVDHQKD
jgi:hypothetical protein